MEADTTLWQVSHDDREYAVIEQYEYDGRFFVLALCLNGEWEHPSERIAIFERVTDTDKEFYLPVTDQELYFRLADLMLLEKEELN